LLFEGREGSKEGKRRGGGREEGDGEEREEVSAGRTISRR